MRLALTTLVMAVLTQLSGVRSSPAAGLVAALLKGRRSPTPTLSAPPPQQTSSARNVTCDATLSAPEANYTAVLTATGDSGMLGNNMAVAEHASSSRSGGVSVGPVLEKSAKIVMLMSDTGGGHRASANALKQALEEELPDWDLTVVMLDIWSEHGTFPYNRIVGSYKFLGKHPRLWKLLYYWTACFPGRKAEVIWSSLTNRQRLVTALVR